MDISECQNQLYRISIYGVGFPNNAFRLIDYSVYPPKTILDYQDTRGTGSFVNTTTHQSNFYFHDDSRLTFGDLLYEAVAEFPRQVRAAHYDQENNLIQFVNFYLREQPQAILKNEDGTFTVVYNNGEQTYMDNSACFNDENEEVDCLEEIPGLKYLGMHENATYFISNEFHSWTNANFVASSYPGAHLLTISSQEENDFIASALQEEAFIGLNDRDEDGVYDWIKSEEGEFENLPGGDELPFVYINPQTGDWNFADDDEKKKFVLEMACLSDSMDVSVVSIERSKRPAFTVFPNPSSGNIHLSLLTPARSSYDYELHNANGQLIEQSTEALNQGDQILSLDLSAYPSGVYFIKLKDGLGHYQTKRLILF